jgi:hypothetical protein
MAFVYRSFGAAELMASYRKTAFERKSAIYGFALCRYNQVIAQGNFGGIF